MRKSLREHLVADLRGLRAGRLFRLARRALAVRLGRNPDGPILATFAVTWRCPLRCAMCDLPARADREIPDREIPSWIDAIADLEPGGLGFTGGEPLLRRALFPALVQSVRRGLVTHLNTSGYTVDESVAARLADTGLASINVSLDHDERRLHDRLRGRDGSADRALAAVERLAEARRRAGVRFRLQVVMAVSIETAGRVAAVRDLVRSRGADGLSLLPVHEFRAGVDPNASLAGALDPAMFDHLALENSRVYLRGIVPFLLGADTPTRCSAPKTALFVDPRGHAYACTPAATARLRGVPTTPRSLGDAFRSGRLAATVPPDRCRRCWWNCHRELDIATRHLTRPPALGREIGRCGTP